MENKINIAELLKDCPKGMELDCTMYDNLYFDSLNADYYGTINCYTLIDGIKTSINFTKYGTFNNHTGAKCVIFPKGKTTWEGFHRPFKDGDIVTSLNTSIYIFTNCSSIVDGYFFAPCGLIADNKSENHHFNVGTISISVDNMRLASEEEKQKLFDAIKANGYKWNAETKTLEKLIKPKFKAGDIIVSYFGTIAVYSHSTYAHDGPYKIVHYKCILQKDGTLKIKNDFGIGYEIDCRLANQEERQKLIDTLKNKGYSLNIETNTLKKQITPKFKVGDRVKSIYNNHQYDIKELTDTHYTLVEVEYKFKYTEPIIEDKNWELVPNKFDIINLKPFDKVLVRHHNAQKWDISFFSHCNGQEKYKYSCINGFVYAQCILYEGNEHLLGTTNDCDDFYKTW